MGQERRKACLSSSIEQNKQKVFTSYDPPGYRYRYSPADRASIALNRRPAGAIIPSKSQAHHISTVRSAERVGSNGAPRADGARRRPAPRNTAAVKVVGFGAAKRMMLTLTRALVGMAAACLRVQKQAPARVKRIALNRIT